MSDIYVNKIRLFTSDNEEVDILVSPSDYIRLDIVSAEDVPRSIQKEMNMEFSLRPPAGDRGKAYVWIYKGEVVTTRNLKFFVLFSEHYLLKYHGEIPESYREATIDEIRQGIFLEDS